MWSLAAFFLLTFAVTWTAWVAVATATPGNAAFSTGGPVFLLGVFAPGLVAVALTALFEGRVGVVRLLARIGTWHVAGRYYLFAVAYMSVTKVLAAATHRVVVGTWPTLGGTSLVVMAAAILTSTWVQAGEEVGWRGYALPRLAARIGLSWASVLVGVTWALWHWPLFVLPATGSTGQSFPIYLLHVTGLSVAMSWLYWKTEGSLLLVMLMHAAVNNTTGIVPAVLPYAVDPMSFQGSIVAWASVGVSWLVAVPLLFGMRGAGVGAMVDSGLSRQ